jgi:signal transduction histidine kinase
MKITTRIAVGLALLTGLMVGVLGYQLRTVNELQAINQELSRTNLEVARLSIRLVQELEGVREFASKSLVLEDEGYEEQWAAWERAVDEGLEGLGRLALGPLERQAIRDVVLGWNRYRMELAPLRTSSEARPDGPELLALLDRIEEAMDELRAGVEAVIDANHIEVTRHAQASAVAGAHAGRVALTAAVGAGVLGFLICIILYFSISGPLRRLTRGTAEIAEGRFHYRLQADGRDELADLARDFNRMATKLDELEEMKRDFTSHVSHELKGPLAAIHETILVLLDRIPGPLNDKQERLLTLSRHSATRLSGMISNLLEISRIESGSLHLEVSRISPVDLVEEVLREVSPLAEDRRLTLEVEDSWTCRWIVGDEELLRDIASNLVGNAVKFSPDDGRIHIRLAQLDSLPEGMPERHKVALAGEEPPFLLMEVEDEGPGIPPEHREGVFEKFYQVRRGVRLKGQGVGLGLAICRKVVLAHGGAVWAEEGAEGGALLRAVLPRIPAAYRDVAPDPGDLQVAEIPSVHREVQDPGKEGIRGASHASPEGDARTEEGSAVAGAGEEGKEGRSGAEASTARAGRVRPGALLLAALVATTLLGASGCTHLGLGSPPPDRANPEPEETRSTSPESTREPTPAEAPDGDRILEEADQRFYEGNFVEAERAFVRYLESYEARWPPQEARALWGLAMIHLLPDSPLHDQPRARTFLEQLSARYAGSVRGDQARWIVGILDELDQIRTQVDQQEALLGQLTETVEQLRRIDLNRRPTRPRPDTLPPLPRR